MSIGNNYLGMSPYNNYNYNNKNDNNLGFDAAKAAEKIVGKDIFKAAKIPENLINFPVDTTQVAVNMGDITGAAGQNAIRYSKSFIYTQMQRNIAAQTFLDANIAGRQPNPDFDYTGNGIPYKYATGAEKRRAEEVYAQILQMLKTQLVAIIAQQRQSYDGLQTAETAMTSQYQQQTKTVSEDVKKAFG